MHFPKAARRRRLAKLVVLLVKLIKLHLQLTLSDEDFGPNDDQLGQPFTSNSLEEVHISITSFKPLSQRSYLKLVHLFLPIRKLFVKAKLGFPALLDLDLIPRTLSNLKALSIDESFMYRLLLHCSLTGIIDLFTKMFYLLAPLKVLVFPPAGWQTGWML